MFRIGHVGGRGRPAESWVRVRANIADADLDEVARVLAVNVAGVFTVLQTVAALLRDAGQPGAIVNTASMAGVGGAPNMAAYSR